jgi:hypothetical protein
MVTSIRRTLSPELVRDFPDYIGRISGGGAGFRNGPDGYLPAES